MLPVKLFGDMYLTMESHLSLSNLIRNAILFVAKTKVVGSGFGLLNQRKHSFQSLVFSHILAVLLSITTTSKPIQLRIL
jgi:ABC-type antimicrobial peptide transport system permease subunit